MGTEILPLTCANCGACLEVSESTRFVTCAYCGSRLEVRRTGNAVYTELLEKIAGKVDHVAARVEDVAANVT